MVKTGDIIPYWLNLLAIVLPLIAVSLILYRRSWRNEILLLLLLNCLLASLHHFLMFQENWLGDQASTTLAIFRLADFSLMVYLFKTFLSQPVMRKFWNFFLVAFLSSIITLYSLAGPEPYRTSINLIQSLVLVLLCLLVLIQLVRQQYLFIFQSALFWIAGGTLCYFSIFLVLIFFSYGNLITLLDENRKEADILTGVFNLVRYGFFIAASISGSRKNQEKEIPLY